MLMFHKSIQPESWNGGYLTVCLTLAMGLFLLVGCQSSDQTGVPLVARVNDQMITIAEFYRECDRRMADGFTSSQADTAEISRIRQEVLDQLIEEKLILSAARRTGIEVSSHELDAAIASVKGDYPGDSFQQAIIDRYVDYDQWKESLRQRLILQKTVSRLVSGRMKISQEEIAEYYQKHLTMFDLPEQVQVKEITCPSMEIAQRIHDKLVEANRNEKDSIKVDLQIPGLEVHNLGLLSRDRLPPQCREAVKGLSAGGVSQPMEYIYGVHLFLVEAVQPPRRQPLTEVRDSILKVLHDEKGKQAYQEWIKDLSMQAAIKINREVFNFQ
ncbi:MAG: SurA N-terminal domain-containing protein [Deltaproteobacteria bacterium]|nr:SurA N-terminal domain-containing protein [Deltaproteobacteria bacterium]